MAMMRMNLGQKASAKNITKVAFAGSPGRVEALQRPGSKSHPDGDSLGVSGSRDLLDVPSEGEGVLPGQVDPIDAQGVQVASIAATPIEQLDEREKEKSGEYQIRELTKKIDLLRDLPESERDLKRFNVTMGMVIMLNVGVIALQTDLVRDEETAFEDKVAWIIIDSIFILIFIFEIMVRAYTEKSAWMWSMWNWFDVLIVFMAVVDVWIITAISGDNNLYVVSILRIVRLIRLVRLVKLVRLLHGLYVILMAFWHAMQTMSFLLLIMVFGILIYAIFAVNLIGRNSTFRDVRINGDTVYDRFGTVYSSMYSLFELMTLEGWESVARPLVEVSPVLFVFIVSFIMIFTFGMLNMIVALVIEKTLLHTRMMSQHNRKVDRIQMLDELLKIKMLFSDDKHESMGQLTYPEFETAFNESEALRNLLNGIGFSVTDVRELYDVLDWDESGEITIKEFFDAMQKLQDGVASPWDALATYALVRNIKGQTRHVQEMIVRLSAEQEVFRGSVEARLQSQDEKLQEVLHRLAALTPWQQADSPLPVSRPVLPIERRHS